MIALLLLTAAAVCHASWNLLVKSSNQKGPEFVWLYAVITTPVALALVVWSLANGTLAAQWWPGLVSMVLHTAYAVVLQRAYGEGEFSVVYAVSRGMTPVLVTLAVIPWTGPPSPRAWWGVAAVLAGVLIMDRVRPGHGLARGSLLGLAVAACSCAYTLWDGYAMASLGVHPLPYLAVASLGQVVVLTAVLAPRRRLRSVLPQWQRALPIALLAPASYCLVLVAMAIEPIGAVATGRTLNVVVGVLLGVLVLRERLTLSRTTGLTAVVAGVLLVSL
ncbi:EamA family transporter [Allokutzneria multivorans]|uniref:EamA family transporter n=1 Tax=Allokutzneria multivorans TaxID=1142134 RepID=A0ABP7SHN0_9PSEU